MEKESLKAYIEGVSRLTDEQLALILSYFKPSTHRAGEVLVEIGDINQYMNYVVSGCLRLFFIKDDGQEATRHIVFEGLFATGLASFITQRPSTEALQVLLPTKLLRIKRSDFYYLREIIPGWERFWSAYLEFAYLNNISIYQREILKDASHRYIELLDKNPAVVLKIPNKVVASYLNMSPETLSRIKSKHTKMRKNS